jgi:hypothetical protein
MLAVVTPTLDSSKGRGQTKGCSWSSTLGFGSEASNLTSENIIDLGSNYGLIFRNHLCSRDQLSVHLLLHSNATAHSMYSPLLSVSPNCTELKCKLTDCFTVHLSTLHWNELIWTQDDLWTHWLQWLSEHWLTVSLYICLLCTEMNSTELETIYELTDCSAYLNTDWLFHCIFVYSALKWTQWTQTIHELADCTNNGGMARIWQLLL